MKDFDLLESLYLQAEKTAQELFNKLKALSLTTVFAESCTAGLVTSLLAGIPGASSALWGSFVCYSQEAKISMLGLDKKEILAYGLVSRETACAMAAMALEKSGASLAAAVTGLAGPEGDGSNVPVGTVWIAAVQQNGNNEAREHLFTGCRNTVRIRAAIAVFESIQNIISK
jgi:PncC family amidohydrolase